MIDFVTTRRNDTTVRALLAAAPELAALVNPAYYDELFAGGVVAAGTTIFTDLELLSGAERSRASAACGAAIERGGRVLNDPRRVLRRYDLLTKLQRYGANRFGVYRVASGERPRRFPVFLRGENDHAGARSPLLRSVAELEEAIARARATGDLADLIAVEFCDTAGPDGLYRKYGAFIVGERILPRHVFFSRDWMVKDWALGDERLLAEERAHLAGNPHAELLRPVFAAAGIEYGRIDYAFADGALQVWEINTNPIIVGIGPSTPVRPPRPPWQRRARRAVRVLKRIARPLLPYAPWLSPLVARRPPPAEVPRPRAPVHAAFTEALIGALRALDAREHGGGGGGAAWRESPRARSRTLMPGPASPSWSRCGRLDGRRRTTCFAGGHATASGIPGIDGSCPHRHAGRVSNAGAEI